MFPKKIKINKNFPLKKRVKFIDNKTNDFSDSIKLINKHRYFENIYIKSMIFFILKSKFDCM